MKRNQPLNELINYIDTELKELEPHHKETLYEKAIAACTAAHATATRNALSESNEPDLDTVTESYAFPRLKFGAVVLGIMAFFAALAIALKSFS